jgi:Na+-transporting methylmalonyl-CoA/oxaloacetate decarboxylase gamma subunit
MEIDMNDALIQSLQITALGMGLVFGAILLLWLMMVLLTFFTAAQTTQTDEATASDSPQPDAERVPQAGFKAQAAALAVAIALAEQGQSTAHPLPEPPTAIVSAWQLGMRTSQRTQKGNFRRR